MNARIKIILSTCAVVAASSAAIIVAQRGFAWTNPTSGPPTAVSAISVSGGNVGIGATPATPLTVKGKIRSIRSNDISYADYSAEAGVATIDSSSGYIYFLRGGTGNYTTGTTMMMDGTGNVGVGTASPAYKLDVQGSAWNNIARLYSTGGSSGIDIWDGGARRGVIYSAGAGGFGLLNDTANWVLRILPGTQNIMGYGDITPNGQTTYGLRGNDLYADTINTGVAGDPLEINNRVAGDLRMYNGDITQQYGHYIYPGSNSGLVDFQKSYYLSSNAGYGLFTNTNLYTAGGLYPQGYGVQGAMSSYGTLSLITPRNSYYGILFGQDLSKPNIMFDTAGNGGLYYESLGRWPIYYIPGTSHMNINTSTDLGATLGVNGTGYFSGNVGIGTTGPLSTLSVGGVGVSGAAIYGFNGLSYGVYGESSQSGGGIGVYGTGSTGVYGRGNVQGVIGYATVANGGSGVYGSALGNGIGVYGSGDISGTGVGGVGGIGVSGYSYSNTGVYGNGGVYDFRGAGGEYGKSGVWTNSSDRNIKENFVPLDNQAILNKIVQLPVTQWNYIKDESKSKHIGPVAQDFYAIFGVGNDNKHISTIDPAGISLVGIKALDEKIVEQQKKIDALEERISKLEK